MKLRNYLAWELALLALLVAIAILRPVPPPGVVRVARAAVNLIDEAARELLGLPR